MRGAAENIGLGAQLFATVDSAMGRDATLHLEASSSPHLNPSEMVARGRALRQTFAVNQRGCDGAAI